MSAKLLLNLSNLVGINTFGMKFDLFHFFSCFNLGRMSNSPHLCVENLLGLLANCSNLFFHILMRLLLHGSNLCLSLLFHGTCCLVSLFYNRIDSRLEFRRAMIQSTFLNDLEFLGGLPPARPPGLDFLV